MKLAAVVYALLVLASLGQTNAKEAEPKVGDPAPELRVSEWIRGKR